MKGLIALAAILLTGCAGFWSSPEQLRAGFHATRAADAGTTMLRDPACMSEGNSLLGSDPSNGTVALFALGQSLIYEGLRYYVRTHHPDEELAFARSFFVVGLIGPVANAYTLARGCQ